MTGPIVVSDQHERITSRTNVALALISGVLMGCAFPPLPAAVLAYIGLVPLLIMLSRIEGVMRPLRYSYIMFFVFNALSLYWVGGFTHGRDPYLMVAGAALLIGHPFFFWIPLAIALHIRRLLGERWMLLALPVLWVGFEYWHSLGDLAFPWITLGNSQASDPARIQFISWTGIYGASLLIVITNVVLYSLWKNIARGIWRPGSARAIAVLITAIILIFLPKIQGELVMRSHPPETLYPNGMLNVGVVQPNIDPWGKWSGIEKFQQLELYQRLTDSLARRGAKLVVWPETAMPYYILLPQYAYDRRALERQLDTLGVDLLTGFPDIVFYPDSAAAPPDSKQTTVTHERYEAFNAAALFLPGESGVQKYHKMLLVPFGEHVPYSNLFSFLNTFEWGVGMSGWNTGRDLTVFRIPVQKREMKFSTLICYESIYPSFVRQFVDSGAEFLIVITNDSWYGKTSGYIQHAEYGRLRAIENRRWVVRCANGGMSAFIDPYGRIIERTEYDTQAIDVASIGLNDEITPYTKYGDVIAIPAFSIGLAAACSVIVFSFIRKKQTGQKG